MKGEQGRQEIKRKGKENEGVRGEAVAASKEISLVKKERQRWLLCVM